MNSITFWKFMWNYHVQIIKNFFLIITSEEILHSLTTKKSKATFLIEIVVFFNLMVSILGLKYSYFGSKTFGINYIWDQIHLGSNTTYPTQLYRTRRTRHRTTRAAKRHLSIWGWQFIYNATTTCHVLMILVDIF